MPDLFLRWSTVCLVIEAKFFTDPAEADLKIQIDKQRDAIKKVKPYTFYKDYHINFAILTINKASAQMHADDIIILVWDDILNLMQNQSNSKDVDYCFKIIQKANARALKEVIEKPKYQKMKYDDLMIRIPDLIREGKIFIGFTGGIGALARATETELINRGHYKVSDIRLTDNWISIDQFLRRVLEVKRLLPEL